MKGIKWISAALLILLARAGAVFFGLGYINHYQKSGTLSVSGFDRKAV